MADENPFPQELAVDAVPIELTDEKIATVAAAIQAAGLSDEQAAAVVQQVQAAAKKGDLSGIISILGTAVTGAAGIVALI